MTELTFLEAVQKYPIEEVIVKSDIMNKLEVFKNESFIIYNTPSSKEYDYEVINKYLKLSDVTKGYQLSNDCAIESLAILSHFINEGGRTEDTWNIIPGNFLLSIEE